MADGFNQSSNPFLFIAPANGSQQTWIGYLFRASDKPPKDFISFEDAWNSSGSYIYCSRNPDLHTPQKIDDFVVAIRKYIDCTYNSCDPFNGRVMAWLVDPYASAFNKSNTYSFRFGSTGQIVATSSDLNVPFTSDLTFSITTGCIIRFNNNAFTFGMPNGSDISLVSQTYHIQGNVSPNTATLSLTNNLRGCFNYQSNFQTQADLNQDCDFDYIRFQLSYFYNDSNNVLFTQDYPLVKPAARGISIVFTSCVDPTDILNIYNPQRTWFAFKGTNTDDSPTVISSWFLTDTAYQVNLIPASGIDPDTGQPLSTTALMLFYNCQPGQLNARNFYLTPAGNFGLALTDANITARQNLLCGISGTEVISFQPKTETSGDLIAFTPGQNAFSPAFPMQDVSLYDPAGKEKPLLDSTCSTSWVSIYSSIVDPVQAPPTYSTQPQGASLYNQDDLIYKKNNDLLGGFSTPSVIENPSTVLFPLVPYAGMQVAGNFDVINFESQVLNPSRRKKIVIPKSKSKLRNGIDPLDDKTEKATTPQGLIATVYTADNSWAELLIAKNLQSGQDIKFTKPDDTLYQAFQVNQQFLVITENNHLGKLVSTLNSGDPVVAPAFYNQMSIEEWPFVLNTGLKKQFGDYTNVLIFKFCEGTLQERARNPQKWTSAKDFNASGEEPDAAQLELTAISQWIQDYIENGIKQWTDNKDPFFQNFYNIVTDPFWNGVLALKTDINLKSFPQELQGLIGGIDISRFNAHHFGIRINPIDPKTIDISSTSSMFGLISYFDQAYEQQLNQGADPNKPVPAQQGVDYDFKVLKLQVLFENTAVKNFSSKAQLTMNKLFSDKVIGLRTPDGTNSTNTIVYNGSYQRQGSDKPSYIFDQVGENQFLFDSNVLKYVEVIKSQFNTIVNQDNENAGRVRSRFNFWGYLSFGIPFFMNGEDKVDMDLFSFGGLTDNVTQTGLNMSNLAIQMDFDVTTPTVRTFTFDTSHLAFDLKQSSLRPDGLYSNFAVQLNGLVTGSKAKKPVSFGYLDVTTQLNSTLPEGDWYGLDCSLNLGTPGALASAAGFTANLLLAWAPGSKAADSNYNLAVGLRLPGTGGDAKLLSLQGVVRVSIGDLKLLYVPEQKSYLLKLIDIGIRFLGIAKLPPGATISFYLFGNPEPGGSKDTLGWYAAYVKPVKDDKETKTLSS